MGNKKRQRTEEWHRYQRFLGTEAHFMDQFTKEERRRCEAAEENWDTLLERGVILPVGSQTDKC